MAYAIVRIRKMSSNNHIAGMQRHNSRTNNVKNADPDLKRYNHTWSKSGTNDLRQDIEQRISESGVSVRSNSVKAIEYLFTASPEAFKFRVTKDQNGKKIIRGETDVWSEFKERSLAWMRKRHGMENVVHVSIHYDEKTPHIHAYCVPIIEKEVEWKNRHGSGVKKEVRLCARDVVGGLQKMYEMHDTFSEKMSSLGLERGKRKSNAKHQDIKTYYDRVNSTVEKEKEMSSFTPKTEEIQIPRPSRFSDLDKYQEELQVRINTEVAEKQQQAIQEFITTFEGDLEKVQERQKLDEENKRLRADLSNKLDSMSKSLTQTSLSLKDSNEALSEASKDLEYWKQTMVKAFRPKTEEERDESRRQILNLIDQIIPKKAVKKGPKI